MGYMGPPPPGYSEWLREQKIIEKRDKELKRILNPSLWDKFKSIWRK